MNLLDTPIFQDPSEGNWVQFGPRVPTRQWSEFQSTIFDAVKSCPDRNLGIEAVAGSGKTTTLVEAMNHCLGRSLFLAFNKSIALDIASKAQGHTVKTLNALGHWQWMQNRPASKLDAKKVITIIKSLMGEGEDFKAFGYTLSRVVGLAKNCCFGLGEGPAGFGPGETSTLDPSGYSSPIVFETSIEQFIDLMDSYQMDIPFEDLPRFAEIAMKALVTSSRDWETFDFDDQLYMPALAGWEYPSYDTVFVDERQDLSPIQHLMLDRLAGRGARLITVGDRHQAIYGFRGALTNSSELLHTKFHTLELPLSISYRCDLEIIREAQTYCSTILSRPSAEEGTVIHTDGEDPRLFSETLVLCRNNAPLFAAILRHYRAKQPCRVLSNFLESFTGFIRGFKTTYTSDLQVKLDRWFDKERSAAEARGFKGKIVGLRDKYETVTLFCKEFKQTEDILYCIRKLGECQTGPTLSTIHKAKGLEHERVYLLRPDCLPSRYATTADAKQQENNLSYVAITRAKHELTYGAMQA